MPARLLLLSRFFLRLDDVIFRVRDTRVYVEFGTGQVLRDYSEMEAPYSKLKEVTWTDFWCKAHNQNVPNPEDFWAIS